MSSNITYLNERYLNSTEKLLAASSKIIRIEREAKEMAEVQQAKIDALRAVAGTSLRMLKILRPAIAAELQGELDKLLIQSADIMSVAQ